MIGFIYKTTNKVNGKSYVGLCTSQKRFENYLGSGIILKQAIEKYGSNNFKREILEECDTEEDLRESEKKWIKHFDAVQSEDFYNLHEGGRGGFIPKKPGTMSKPIKEYWEGLSVSQRKERTKNSGKYDKGGSKNPTAKRAKVNGKTYHCLKDVLEDINIPYSTLKALARGASYPKWEHINVEYI